MEVEKAIRESALYQKVMAQPPHWGHEKILKWDDGMFRELEPFLTHHYWADGGTLNVFNVVGTKHPDYQGLTWLEFIHQGKRMSQNLPKYDGNPVYYNGTEKKSPEMSFLSMDGMGWYVDDDGNHRTGIAKFAFFYQARMELHGLKLNDYRFDHEMYGLYLKVGDVIKERKLAGSASIIPKSVRGGRRDTAGWRLDLYKPNLVFAKHRESSQTLTTAQEVNVVLDSLTIPAYRRWFKAWG